MPFVSIKTLAIENKEITVCLVVCLFWGNFTQSLSHQSIQSNIIVAGDVNRVTHLNRLQCMSKKNTRELGNAVFKGIMYREGIRWQQ